LPEETANAPGNPLIVMGDKIAPKPHLTAFLKDLRTENAMLDPEESIMYAVCQDSNQVALTLKNHLDNVKMVLIGPGLVGNGVTVARMLGSKAHIVMVVDPGVNPLGPDPETYTKIQRNLEELGVIIVLAKDATISFYQPLIQECVLSGMAAGADFGEMSPEERAAMIDKRLEAVNSFPSLPDTQRKVAELDDLDPPKKWAEAIDPDLPTKTVILKILNSARYGFRSRVETIDQAVALASARTIREIVTACQIRQIFSKTEETTIDQFWRHPCPSASSPNCCRSRPIPPSRTPSRKPNLSASSSNRSRLTPCRKPSCGRNWIWRRRTTSSLRDCCTTSARSPCRCAWKTHWNSSWQ
jgi:hypothetical protein